MFSFFETYSNVYMPNIKSRVLMGSVANSNIRRAAGARTTMADRPRPTTRPGMWGDPL